MTVKTVNNIAKYNDLVLTLLVFDIFSHIINEDALILFTIERVKVINLIISEVAKLYVER